MDNGGIGQHPNGGGGIVQHPNGAVGIVQHPNGAVSGASVPMWSLNSVSFSWSDPGGRASNQIRVVEVAFFLHFCVNVEGEGQKKIF